MSDISKKIDSIEKLAKEAERLAKNLQVNPFSVFERMASDIKERKDNTMAMEFTKCIGELLKKNGVSVKITEYQTENHATNKFEMLYGCSIDELDFSEHDKVFADRIVELLKKNDNLLKMINELQLEKAHIDCELYDAKQSIYELESNETVDLPFDPLECANYLINATYEREANSVEKAVTGDATITRDKYSIDDLEQIAEHLLVYCKHNKET